MSDMDIIMNTEMIAFSVSIEGKSPNTRKVYLSKLHDIHTIFGKAARDITVEELIEFAGKKYKKTAGDKINPNTLSSFVNVVILIRYMAELETKEFTEYYDVIRQEIKELLIKKNGEFNVVDMPSMEDIQEHEKILWETKSYDKFIVHYLLTHYYTRNEDLNVKLATNASQLDNSGNFLLLNKKPVSITYIRNSYKTVSTYGTKHYTITDKNFIKAFKELIKIRPQILDNDGQPDKDGAIGQYVRTITLNNLPEGIYLKVKLLSVKDKTELIAIGERRGTSPNTLLTSYNYDYNKTDD